jgi:tetratricopeptide (TPR) repeat protein
MRERIDELRARLDEDPTDEDALDRLVAAACADEDWRLALHALQQLADLAADIEPRMMALARIAEIAETKLGDLELAQSAYEQILESDPSRQVAQEGLARIRNVRNG